MKKWYRIALDADNDDAYLGAQYELEGSGKTFLDQSALVAALPAINAAAMARVEELEAQLVTDAEDAQAWRDYQESLLPENGAANWALRLALIDIGKLASDVEAAIDTIEDETEQAKARERWRYREGRVLKDHAITQFVAGVFGLDAPAVDALFVEAGKYQIDPDYVPA